MSKVYTVSWSHNLVGASDQLRHPDDTTSSLVEARAKAKRLCRIGHGDARIYIYCGIAKGTFAEYVKVTINHLVEIVVLSKMESMEKALEKSGG